MILSASYFVSNVCIILNIKLKALTVFLVYLIVIKSKTMIFYAGNESLVLYTILLDSSWKTWYNNHSTQFKCSWPNQLIIIVCWTIVQSFT